jgi:hypothetical protein
MNTIKERIISIEKKSTIFKYISLLKLIGIILGIGGGYMYYYYIGCVSGSCPITSNPWTSVAWGGILGYLVGDLLSSKKKRAQKKED